MNFWNYKCLAKRLHEKQLSNTETVIFLLISLVFGIFSFFISQIIAVFLWHITMPSFEKRLMNKIKSGEFLSTILVLSCPSYIRNFVYGLILYVVSLPFILGSQSNMSLPLGVFMFASGSLLGLGLFAICIYDMYQALRTFSRLTFDVWEKTRQKEGHNPEGDDAL